MKMTLAKRRQTVARPKADSGKCRDNKQEAGDTEREREGQPQNGPRCEPGPETGFSCAATSRVRVPVRVGCLHAKPLLTRLLYLWP